jgi:hypothetical protein
MGVSGAQEFSGSVQDASDQKDVCTAAGKANNCAFTLISLKKLQDQQRNCCTWHVSCGKQ